MSHVPQRKEKDCLNCGAIVQGRYCHVCGQENVVPKETFWHMFTHFFYDITHFDSGFFITVKDLVIKPGFLSKEYMIGRRASYLHPVRMYVFTSAVFFLLFFSLFKPKDAVHLNMDEPLNAKDRQTYIVGWENEFKKDSSNKEMKAILALFKDTTKIVTPRDVYKAERKGIFTVNFADKAYETIAEYDSVQKTRPAAERDGWLERRFAKLGINISRNFREDPQGAAEKLADKLLHKLPYLLLISMPFFALILKLVYIRRKQFYYADHGVFTIHLYVFSFMALLLVFAIDELQKFLKASDLEFLEIAVFIWLLVYLLLAMKRFYGQKWGKTFIKFLLVWIISLVMMLILLTTLFLFSAATI